jgi:HupE / UreJ protein
MLEPLQEAKVGAGAMSIMSNYVSRALCAAVVLGVVATGTVEAHEIRPAVVTIGLAGEAPVEIAIALNLEALLANVGPEHKDSNDSPQAATYNALRALEPAALRARFAEMQTRWLGGVTLEGDGVRLAPTLTSIDVPAIGDTKLARISTVRLTTAVPPGAKELRWRYGAEFGSSVVRLKRPGEETLELGWLKDGQASDTVAIKGAAAMSTVAKFLNYVVIGFTHILPHGLDHILFVLGLYLLGTSWRPLLIQVTAFTVAHSITLALGLYGVVAVPSGIVEPLIALSIVYVAVENIITNKLTIWRPAIVFAFGLLHGLGFASVLQEIDLPRADYLTGLIGFNIGVELGQLAVIALAFLATGLWFRDKPWYRERIVWPASAAIALVGAFWTVERIWVG